MNFQSLMSQARQVASLVQQGAVLYEHLKSNLEAAKDALSEDQQAELQKVLDDIHAQNMKLSSDLDTALAAAEKRG